MEERTLLYIATGTAIAGLVILFLTTTGTSDGFRLHGTAIAARGTHITVLANVTLIARSVHKGDTIDLPAFWGGESFVAVPQQEKPQE